MNEPSKLSEVKSEFYKVITETFASGSSGLGLGMKTLFCFIPKLMIWLFEAVLFLLGVLLILTPSFFVAFLYFKVLSTSNIFLLLLYLVLALFCVFLTIAFSRVYGEDYLAIQSLKLHTVVSAPVFAIFWRLLPYTIKGLQFAETNQFLAVTGFIFGFLSLIILINGLLWIQWND